VWCDLCSVVSLVVEGAAMTADEEEVLNKVISGILAVTHQHALALLVITRAIDALDARIAALESKGATKQ
jgi:hypothetical protein